MKILIMFRMHLTVLFLLAVVTGTPLWAESEVPAHNEADLSFREEMNNNFIGTRIGGIRDNLNALEALRGGDTDAVFDYLFLLAMADMYDESDEKIAFVETQLPGFIGKGELGPVMEFLEYHLDILVWDLWENLPEENLELRQRALAALDQAKNYRLAHPRKQERLLDRALITVFPGDPTAGVDYTFQAKTILENCPSPDAPE